MQGEEKKSVREKTNLVYFKDLVCLHLTEGKRENSLLKDYMSQTACY